MAAPAKAEPILLALVHMVSVGVGDYCIVVGAASIRLVSSRLDSVRVGRVGVVLGG